MASSLPVHSIFPRIADELPFPITPYGLDLTFNLDNLKSSVGKNSLSL